LVNGSVAASFTAAQLAAGLVSFRHNGSETTAASFRVVVEDGKEDNSAPTPATFNFTVNPVNDAPIRSGDLRAAVAEGGTYKLTT
ncbi:cadherin-like domain-containing protein, partial [Ensifer sp. P24N7]|uniref:cadherin-like domain-containing protein n=1 Tax=Sinorhizobium sp. P24N7 TaxID=3348358 RepID=UPI0035F3E927